MTTNPETAGVEPVAYCNKCGYYGPVDQYGRHPRPRDGVQCNYTATTRPAPEQAPQPKCFECGDSGEVFGHADDCDNDSCALNGDIDSCLGKVEPCGCAPLAPDHANYSVGEEPVGCPFCGEKPLPPKFQYESGRWDIYAVECDDCDISIYSPSGFEGAASANQAVIAWNRRAALAAMPTPAAIRAETTAQIVAWLLDLANSPLTHPILAFIGDPCREDGRELAERLAAALGAGDHLTGGGE